jgi:3-oxoacyl-[acyl-carrier-protein] synthase-1
MTARVKAFGEAGGAAPLLVGTAAFNGLGFNAHQSWAFWRAEISPWTESPFACKNGERATMAHARTLPLRSFGVLRLVELAREAWSELAPKLEALPAGARVGLYLGISERFRTGNGDPFGAQRRALETRLQKLPGKVPLASVSLFPHGHSATAFALQEAGMALASRAVDAAVVGGLDTYYDPPVIETLIQQARLFDKKNTTAIIPGEGAAFALVARSDVQRQAGLPGVARVETVSTALEPSTLTGDAPCAAVGLGEALRGVTSRLKAQRRMLEWMISDVTNEDYRTHEFGLAVPRAGAPGGLDTGGKDYFQVIGPRFAYDFLPECFGDLGAASIATGMVLAAECFRRSVPPRRNCLVAGSSVCNERGAVLLSAVDAAA